MSRIVTPVGTFELVAPADEKEFEAAVVSNAASIFGPGRYYLDCKRRIGPVGGRGNIP
ncbi:MAG: hypothetical protein QOF58_8703, partial [Pseudonocardiales bacterium]|nr:hypothetical protein [Pseudonocardiales bacterium]